MAGSRKDVLGILEGGDTGEGDEAAELEDPVHQGCGPGEAVEDGLHLGCKRFVKSKDIVK